MDDFRSFVVLAIFLCHLGSSTASEPISQFPNPGKEEVNVRSFRNSDYNEDVDRAVGYDYYRYRPQPQWVQYRALGGPAPYPIWRYQEYRMTPPDQVPPTYRHFSNYPTAPRSLDDRARHDGRDRNYGDDTTSPPEEVRGHRPRPREMWNYYGPPPREVELRHSHQYSREQEE